LLVDFADGEAGREDADRLRDHLSSCPGCRETLAALSTSLARAQAVWAADLEAIQSPPVALPRRRRWWRRSLIGAAAVAAAALLVAVLWPPAGGAPQERPERADSGDRSVASLEREIWRIGVAEQSLAIAEQLDQTPGGRPYAVSRWEFVVAHFPETEAAGRARARLAAAEWRTEQ